MTATFSTTFPARVSAGVIRPAFLLTALFVSFFIPMTASSAVPPTAEASEYRLGMFGKDSAEAARSAWANRDLYEYALAVEAAPLSVSQDAIRSARSLEAAWDAYFAGRALPAGPVNREAVTAKLVRHCRVRPGNPSCAPMGEVFKSAGDEELRSLYAAALLIDFARSQGLEPELGAGVTDLLLRKKFNCASVSTMALHLLQRSGVESFRALQLPDHVTLALELEAGVTVYLNNAQEFLPRSFFENPMTVTGYPRIANEKTVSPGAVLASTFVRSGKLHFAKRSLGAAVENWRAALKIDPECPTTLNNLGVIFAMEKNWDRAGALYRRALAVNPHYARASDNLNRVSALLTR